ncbi:MAG TPA: LacI family DNA-binding transcriptional regulator [Opitutaceae bacterium]|jgi:DNA-binding LacI/PurR family transcriptional regulator
MSLAPASHALRRPSLADIARVTGFSRMTVSYALRQHPKISAPTRRRVLAAAREIGYVANPEVSRLMQLLRSRRLASYQSTLAFLSFHDSPKPISHRYTRDVIAGAKARAAELGFSADVFNLARLEIPAARLTTVLRSRGIRGILIPPLPDFLDCAPMLDWSQFSVIAATYSARNLLVNRTVPHHQLNVLRALTELRKLGCRRAGLIVTGDLLHRANYAYHASLALRQQLGEFAPIPPFSPEAVVGPNFEREFRRWMRQHRPDVLLTVESVVARLIRLLGSRYPQGTGLCMLDHNGTSEMAGIDQHAALVGAAALDLLAGQLQRAEIGLNPHPRVTMVEGTWVSGNSLRSG